MFKLITIKLRSGNYSIEDLSAKKENENINESEEDDRIHSCSDNEYIISYNGRCDSNKKKFKSTSFEKKCEMCNIYENENYHNQNTHTITISNPSIIVVETNRLPVIHESDNTDNIEQSDNTVNIKEYELIKQESDECDMNGMNQNIKEKNE